MIEDAGFCAIWKNYIVHIHPLFFSHVEHKYTDAGGLE